MPHKHFVTMHSRRLNPPFHKLERPGGRAGIDGAALTSPNISCATWIDDAGTIRQPHSDLETFLESELDLKRLNKIHDLLWWAGRPVPARPLHRQKMRGRSIVITEDLDLHLSWIDAKLYLKPLPRNL